MGLLDMFMKNPNVLGDLTQMVSKNPQIMQAARSLLSPNDASVGGSSGLGGILGAMQSGGMGDAVSSWLGGGANQAISPDQVQRALGNDSLSQFASKAGIGASEAGTVLAGLLPALVDQMSPDGKLPDTNQLDDVLGKLLG